MICGLLCFGFVIIDLPRQMPVRISQDSRCSAAGSRSGVRHGVRRRRTQPSGGRIGKRGRPGRTRGASDRSLSLKAQARKSTEKEPELEKITVATPKKKEMCTKGMTCKPGDELEVEVRGKDTVAEVVPSPPLLLSVRHASDVFAVRDCS